MNTGDGKWIVRLLPLEHGRRADLRVGEAEEELAVFRVPKALSLVQPGVELRIGVVCEKRRISCQFFMQTVEEKETLSSEACLNSRLCWSQKDTWPQA